MHQSKVISPRVTTKNLVTTLFPHNLSATNVMPNLQVLEDNVNSEKNKTKLAYRILIQTYSFQPSHTHKICNCVGDSYGCRELTMTWMTCHRCCMGESFCPDASWSCAWITPSLGPNCPSPSSPHASPPPPPYRPGQTPPTELPPGLTLLCAVPLHAV